MPISLAGPHVGDVTTQGLIDQYCFPGSQMSGKNIPMKGVMGLSLRTVLFTRKRIFGSQGAHQECRSHMLYALEAMAPTVFNSVEALLVTFKEQLTKCHQGELNFFGYGTILV